MLQASGLTANSNWIRYFSARGFNVLTYKTVRSRQVKPHRYPHWVFIQDTPNDISEVIGDLQTWPKSLSQFSTANSFGVPSLGPDKWRPDVERSLEVIGDGQLLILSVTGSGSGPELVRDFVEVAKLGVSTGVSAIELNVSCPNTIRPDDDRSMGKPICENIVDTLNIIKSVRDAIGGEVKLLAKLSYMPPREIQELMSVIAPEIDGVALINTVQPSIRRADGTETPFIGTSDDANRKRGEAGIAGYAIRNLARQAVSAVAEFRSQSSFSFDILGMGGVMTPSDAHDMTNLGADAVQSVSGACLNPELAASLVNEALARSEYPEITDLEHQGDRPRASVNGTRSKVAAGLQSVGRVLASGGLNLILESNR